MKPLVYLLMLFLSVYVFACGGGGGDSAPAPLEQPTYNLSGTWSVTETTGANTCSDPVGVIDNYTVTIVHAAGSNSMTMTSNSTGASLNATISGTRMTYSGSGYDPSCSSLSMSINGTANSATSLNGTTTWTCYYGATSCTGTDYFVSTKQAPAISGFSPAIGAIGTLVTITGTNFSATSANNAVKFNEVTATLTNSTATSITALVPVGATTGPISVAAYGQTATSVSNFTVDGGGIAEVEPNDSASSAQTIAASKKVYGAATWSVIEDNPNIDWYKITPTTTKSYTITLTFDNSADLDLFLLNASETQIASSAQFTGTTETITYTLSQGAQYYVLVSPYQNYGTTNYTLMIQ